MPETSVCASSIEVKIEELSAVSSWCQRWVPENILIFSPPPLLAGLSPRCHWSHNYKSRPSSCLGRALGRAAWLGHPSHQGMWDFYPSECFKQNLRLFTQWFTPGRLGKDFLNFVVTDCFELNKTKDGAGIRHGVTTLHTMLTALSWRSQGPASPCPVSLPCPTWAGDTAMVAVIKLTILW